MGGDSSESISGIFGVPQGSVLGHLLFLAYINHVSSLNLTYGSKITMYAEDILLFKPSDQSVTFSDLQRNINTKRLEWKCIPRYGSQVFSHQETD